MREEGRGGGGSPERGKGAPWEPGVGRGQACRREPVCKAAAWSCSRLGAPGPGEGERLPARSMSFSDSSATFLLNEVNARAPSPVGEGRLPPQLGRGLAFGGRLQ